jgi:hypothetical protein
MSRKMLITSYNNENDAPSSRSVLENLIEAENYNNF